MLWSKLYGYICNLRLRAQRTQYSINLHHGIYGCHVTYSVKITQCAMACALCLPCLILCFTALTQIVFQFNYKSTNLKYCAGATKVLKQKKDWCFVQESKYSKQKLIKQKNHQHEDSNPFEYQVQVPHKLHLYY